MIEVNRDVITGDLLLAPSGAIVLIVKSQGKACEWLLVRTNGGNIISTKCVMANAKDSYPTFKLIAEGKS